MELMLWPLMWIGLMLGLWTAFAAVAFKDSRARAKAAKEMAERQKAMEQSSQMMPMEGEGMESMDAGFDDGFGEAGQGDFADLDENAFK
jgi:hypothetical protein